MVARLAAFWGGWPEHVWEWPLHYYRARLKDYLDILRQSTPVAQSDKSVRRRTVGPITIEEFQR